MGFLYLDSLCVPLIPAILTGGDVPCELGGQ